MFIFIFILQSFFSYSMAPKPFIDVAYDKMAKLEVEKFFKEIEGYSEESKSIVIPGYYQELIKRGLWGYLKFCPPLRDKEQLVRVLRGFDSCPETHEEEALEAIRVFMLPFVRCSNKWCRFLFDEAQDRNVFFQNLVNWALHPELVNDKIQNGDYKYLLSLSDSSLRFILHDIISLRTCDEKGRSILHCIMDERDETYDRLTAYFIRTCPDLLFYEDHWERTPLHIAAQYHPHLFFYLINKGYFTLPPEHEFCSYLGENFLHFAVKGKNLSLVQFLINHGYSPLTKNDEEKTPLHLAVVHCDSLSYSDCDGDLIALLTPDVKSIDIQDVEGNTALHLAIQQGKLMIVKQLVERGADFGIQNKKGRTALHEWVYGGEALEDLEFLEHVCDDHVVNMQDHEGQTALHLAAKENNVFMLNFLFSKDVGVLKNKNGHTPLVYMMDENLPQNMRDFLKMADNKGFSWQEDDIDDFFYYAKKGGQALCGFIMLEKVYANPSYTDDKKNKWVEDFLDIFKYHLFAFASFDVALLISDTELSQALQEPFIRMAVSKNVPLRLDSLAWDIYETEAFFQFLDKVPPQYPLIMEGFGTLLMALIVQHCRRLDDRYVKVCLKLIEKGCGVNELTTHGTPLSYMICIRGGHMRLQLLKVKLASYPLIDALLKHYSSNIVVKKGRALDPRQAEREHMGILQDVFLEYGEHPLSAPLVYAHPSRELYDKVKENVSLTQRNGFKRNFLHHLSLIESAFERDLNGLFKRRQLSLDEIQTLINQKDVEGMTPLMYATNNPKMLEQLIDLGADCHAVDKRGFSIRHHLFLSGNHETLRMFLNKKNVVLNGGENLIQLKRKLAVDCDMPLFSWFIISRASYESYLYG